tara:strand:- start:7675 stop:8628 length:954 start_codon:yes stop_codon:yes gene_type:complete
MKIIKLLYYKYGLSFLLCIMITFFIFFIFSLIGNLNEDYLFKTVIQISMLNSLQILIYVPIFIFLISVILMSIFLRSKNEFIVIKSYINLEKLLIFFIPIVLIFSILETNKKELALLIENNKTKLISENNVLTTKILLEKNNNTKIYKVFNNIDLNNIDKIEYRFYKILNNRIVEAEFSDDLFLNKADLMANNYTVYKDETIKDLSIKKIFQINFFDIISYNNIVKNISKKKNIFEFKNLILLVFSFLLLTYIFFIFFDKKYVNTKQSINPPIFISIIFIFYSFLIFNNSLSLYKILFEILACVVIGMLILRMRFNE